MPHVKYHISFQDAFERTVDVYLIQEDEFETPIELVADSNPVTISYQGDESDLFQTMVTSKATIRVALPDSGSELFEDIATMDENTFGVMITISNGGVGEFVWNGWLVPDEQIKTFSYYSQNIVLTAIDPISRLKGQKLLNSDETYITGVKTLKYIVERCFEDVFTTENTFITFQLVVKSKMVLNANSTTIFPDILEQLAVPAESFNDDMGRPISAFDVISRIANALFMRCFYENGNIYFIDILDFGIEATTPRLPIYYKEFAGITPGNDSILLENSENIATTRTYRETRVRFQYNGTTGILIDGYLANWESFGGGYRLADWQYDDLLLSKPDVYNRRVGTGRQESPYGITIKYYDGIGGGFEFILGKSDISVMGGSVLSIAIKFKAPNQGLIPIHNDTYDIDIPIGVGGKIIIFNPVDPTQSLYYGRVGSVVDDYYYAWIVTDLSGTPFESGVWDTAPVPAGSFGIQGTRTSDRQEVTFDFPPIPINIHGRVFIAINGISYNSNLSSPPPEATDTVIYEVILSQKPKNIEKETSKGEITYISRKVRTSQEYILRDVELNSSANATVSGSLYSAIPYELFGETIPPGPIGNICIDEYGGLLEFGVPLIMYIAIAQMWLNYPQYKIECETRGRGNEFYKGVDFSCFYDISRPSTDIYNNVFAQTMSIYELKTATRRITAISMKLNQRDISNDTFDEENDLAEFYFIT